MQECHYVRVGGEGIDCHWKKVPGAQLRLTRVVVEGCMSRGPWAPEENALFVEGLQLYGKHWKQVASTVRSRSVKQCTKHLAQLLTKSEEEELLRVYEQSKQEGEKG
ncbi:hypothetical protein B484DRAFT_411275 [Ochromonadaceae sp. CCMP2298]|nr:hypothetical protein B484DRAFT_411275 [Ochromonadaceae sp. CCMP2298]